MDYNIHNVVKQANASLRYAFVSLCNILRSYEDDSRETILLL